MGEKVLPQPTVQGQTRELTDTERRGRGQLVLLVLGRGGRARVMVMASLNLPGQRTPELVRTKFALNGTRPRTLKLLLIFRQLVA